MKRNSLMGNTAAKRKTLTTAAILFGVAGGMVGLAFASVPLYQLFCQVTGFGGTPKIGVQADAGKANAHAGKMVTVRFDANVNKGMPWSFQPEQREVRVPIGESVLAFYVARNLSDKAVTGTATFNITPYKTAEYFNKVQCFCFTEQVLEPGQEVRMPVTFFVDPDLFDDRHAKDVDAITLSYTFFRKKQEAEAKAIEIQSGLSGGKAL